MRQSYRPGARARLGFAAAFVLALAFPSCLPERRGAGGGGYSAPVSTDAPPPKPSDGAGTCPFVSVADTVQGRASLLAITGDVCGNVELLSVKAGSVFENCGQEGDFIRVRYKEAAQGAAPVAQGLGGCDANGAGESYIKGCVHRRDLACVGSPGSTAAQGNGTGAGGPAGSATGGGAGPSNGVGGVGHLPQKLPAPSSSPSRPPGARCAVGETYCTVIRNGQNCWKDRGDRWQGMVVTDDDLAIVHASLATCFAEEGSVRVAWGPVHRTARMRASRGLGGCLVEASNLRCSK